MNDIQELKDKREALLHELEKLEAGPLPFEAALESPEDIDRDQERALRDEFNARKRRIDSIKFEISRIDQKLHRREAIAEQDARIAEYISGMENWKADKEELLAKRESLNVRLEQVSKKAVEDMSKARQAETEAASAYARAVAWGDEEGEKNANDDAQKAAKNLVAATEHNRRQQLIITALEVELVTVDKHVMEAEEEYKKLERSALYVAHYALEEKWNAAARQLLDVGAKLYAAGSLIERDGIEFLKLNIPELGENYGHWQRSDMSELANYDVQDILAR
ncbi:chromosome segregation protein SMC [Pseudomonas violetae]|uniref:Chromosome segregation protein SMC n=1 Tax=Pseudomonas violetae TaxID=2915813 RepID=A0ABT0EYE3_9PSED|nr:chromosome segregation protein SMC [Pseudomonas violetae]MCK1790762.1 chromosome segregation protein SMC [Pseudomonas violetae]